MTTNSLPTPFQPGPRLIDGSDLNAALANPLSSSSSGLTATAGGVLATSLQLRSRLNQVSTVATTADGVKLPAAIPGAMVYVINDGTNALQVFPFLSTDTIDAIAAATGVALSAASRALFMCSAAGVWQSMKGAKSS